MRLKLVSKIRVKTFLLATLFSLVAVLFWVELIGLTFVFGDLEIDQDVFWKLHPSFFSGVNKSGYRGRFVNPDVPKQGLRILALGDSSTYGIAIFLPSYTYSGRLEKFLNEGGMKCEVVNLGVSGYTLYQGLKLLEKLIPELRPDVCLFYFGHNDGQYSRTELADSNRMLIKAPLENSVLPRFLRTARFYQFAKSEWGQIQPVSQRSARVPLDEYKKLMEQAIKLCQRNGIVPI